MAQRLAAPIQRSSSAITAAGTARHSPLSSAGTNSRPGSPPPDRQQREHQAQRRPPEYAVGQRFQGQWAAVRLSSSDTGRFSDRENPKSPWRKPAEIAQVKKRDVVFVGTLGMRMACWLSRAQAIIELPLIDAEAGPQPNQRRAEQATQQDR